MEVHDIEEHFARKLGVVYPVVISNIESNRFKIHIPIADGGRGEDYGFIFMEPNGNGKVQFYKSKGPGGAIFYDDTDIIAIKPGPRGQIEVMLSNTAEITFCKASTKPEGWDNVPSCSPKAPSQRMCRYYIYRVWDETEDMLYWDELKRVPMINADYFTGRKTDEPWRVYQGEKDPVLEYMVQRLELESVTVVRNGVEEHQNLRVFKKPIDSIFKEILSRHHINPFVEELQRVIWDGTRRLDSFLSDIGGYARGVLDSEQRDYLATVSRAFFTSIIERNVVKNYPPIQFMLILSGPQNAKKSAFCSKLAFSQWHKPTTRNPSDVKKYYEDTKGAIITEWIEGVGLGNMTPAELKAAIDLTKPQFRWAYAEDSDEYTIHSTIVLTTNEEIISTDATGNRRLFPVFFREASPRSILDYSDEDIWQLWAEALYYFNNGERWNTNLYKDGLLRDWFIRAQADISEPEVGGALLREFFDFSRPNIGSHVTVFEIREFLEAQDTIPFSQIEEIISSFEHHASGYGWEKVKGPYTIRTAKTLSGYTTTRKAWVRIKPPMLKEGK